MDALTYLICFALFMVQLWRHDGPNNYILAASLIGMALCSIAGAINSFKNRGK